MTDLDAAIVEALTEWWASLCDDPDDAAIIRTAPETTEEAERYAAALTPTLAAAVERAKAEGIAEGERRVRERVEAALKGAWHNHSPRIYIVDCRARLADDLRAALAEGATTP